MKFAGISLDLLLNLFVMCVALVGTCLGNGSELIRVLF